MAGTTSKKAAQNSQRGTLQALTTPLAFLGLALLIIEATLAVVLSNSRLSEEHLWSGFLWMIGIFTGIIVIAAMFFWLKPQNLLFGKEEHSTPRLEPSALKDQIEDLIAENVKPEALKERAKP